MKAKKLTVYMPSKTETFEDPNLVIEVKGTLAVSVDYRNERREFHGFPFEVIYDTSDEYKPTPTFKSTPKPC